MKDNMKTKEQVIQELKELRQRNAELEKSESERKQAEKALREKSQLFKEVMDSAQEGIIVYGRDLRYKVWNPFMERLSGVPASDVLGNHPLEVFPFLRDAGVIERIEQALAGETPTAIDFPYSLPEVGRTNWTSDMSSPLRNAEGEIIGVIATVRDITERKRAEEALRESEENYRNLFENANEAIFVAQDGKIVFFNPRTLMMIGYSGEEIVSRPFTEFIYPDDRDMVIARHVRRLKGEEFPLIYSFRIIQRGGNVRWVELNTLVINWKGKAATLNFLTEITERKRAEKAVEEKSYLNELLMNTLPHPAMIITKDRKVLAMNKIASDVGVIIGDYCWKEFGKSDYLSKEAKKRALTGDVNGIKCTFCKADESLEGRCLENDPEVDAFGRKWDTYWVAIDENTFLHYALDITDRKQAEKDLLRLQKLESLGVLAGGIAHDFNNLLVGIMGNASIALLNEGDPKKQEQLLEEVVKASEKAAGLTQQLLTFAKGGIPSMKIASIATVVKEAASLSVGQSSQVKCTLTLPEDLWAMEMDTGQIGQVFQNLIINGRQAMPEGGIIQIQAENVELSSENPLGLKSGDFVHILVKDNGIGIPEKYLQKIFDPYFSTKEGEKNGGGSGLGLAISHSVVQKHNGAIYANSTQGKGTTLHIYLPANRNAVLKKESVGESSIAMKSLKILAMDDNQMVLNLMASLFERLRHLVEFTEDGQEAVEKYREALRSEAPFDLVILDLTIPGGMGGVETLEKLKEIDPKVIAIISSGFSDKVPSGFAGVLPKPYGIKDLVRVLEEVMMWS